MQEILVKSELSIEKSRPGRRGVRYAKTQKQASDYLPAGYLRQENLHLHGYRNKIIAWMDNSIRWVLVP